MASRVSQKLDYRGNARIAPHSSSTTFACAVPSGNISSSILYPDTMLSIITITAIELWRVSFLCCRWPLGFEKTHHRSYVGMHTTLIVLFGMY